MKSINTTILVTGGSGFFGEVLLRKLLKRGYNCINIDLFESEIHSDALESFQLDICDIDGMREICSKYSVSAIIHCAAQLAHEVQDNKELWRTNVDGTHNIAQIASELSIPKVIFISTNCLWGKSLNRPVREDDVPAPIEVYGRSKYAAEKILLDTSNTFASIIIRSPTIIDAGRLGLLSILFEFIHEGKRVWMVGDGENRYQFIDAQELADACILSLDHMQTDIFNIGSDNVKTLREIYQYIIDKTGSRSKVTPVRKNVAVIGMKICSVFGLIPLGRYHYNMIAEDFIFDTTKIKRLLSWSTKISNEEMLYAAYEYYEDNYLQINNRISGPAHKKRCSMGILKLLKWIS